MYAQAAMVVWFARVEIAIIKSLNHFDVRRVSDMHWWVLIKVSVSRRTMNYVTC